MHGIEVLQRRLREGQPILGGDTREVQALRVESGFGRGRYRSVLRDVENYCMFVGYPRSGHSLVGALLDAHPNIVMAHELNVLRFMAVGFDRSQIEYLMIENARRCAAAGHSWGSFDYRVAGQWQGRFRTIKVLGDKKGGHTTRQIQRDPALLQALFDLFDNRVKLLHVVRNPFDVIATMFRKASSRLADTTRNFFHLARTNQMIRQKLGPARILDIRHKRMLGDPVEALSRACAFLGVSCDPDYLEAGRGSGAGIGETSTPPPMPVSLPSVQMSDSLPESSVTLTGMLKFSMCQSLMPSATHQAPEKLQWLRYRY